MSLCRWEQYERHGTGDPGCDIREGIMFCANGDLDLRQGLQFWEAVGKGTSRPDRIRHILSAENPEEGRCRNADDQSADAAPHLRPLVIPVGLEERKRAYEVLEELLFGRVPVYQRFGV